MYLTYAALLTLGQLKPQMKIACNYETPCYAGGLAFPSVTKFRNRRTVELFLTDPWSMDQADPGADFTNDFSDVIQIRWKVDFSVTQL